METLVAYAAPRPDSAERAARVEAYYGREIGHKASDAAALPELFAGDDLFEVQSPDGPVWSNRPVAALLFAGIPAAPSPRGWTYAAACGWFLADSTPYDGVVSRSHIVAEGKEADVPADRIDEVLSWHRRTEGINPVHDIYGQYYPAPPPELDSLPAVARHLLSTLVPAAGPSDAARYAVAVQIERTLRDAVRSGLKGTQLLDHFYDVEHVRQAVPPVRRPQRLADAPDRDRIEFLLVDVDGFDNRALSTLWAASVAGASSAAAEAMLRQALRRATFDLFLAEVNRHLSPERAAQ
ncbi:hypothetical protein HPO96_29900 [Kribbella sandramycini]|uniref:Uncharacterized protein n=1 Tax=Kribbella sandramycini TaxID=60450 RepID=A0A7Y4L4Y0_9ACTN|nr:hypothetical protein [Kribbella sandramycini]MBB6571827.1 hypothetical protein [Kribbella sandramycini]NOL44469.1 hypothetical protein [Kribbella sandramycini]